MRASSLLFLFAVLPLSSALAAPPGAIPSLPPAPAGSPALIPVLAPPSSLADHPKAIPISSLPPSQQTALKDAAAKYSSALGPVAKVLGNTDYLINFMKLQQARRAAGVNVLNGVK